MTTREGERRPPSELAWLVVVAHPDDEILGCGALLSRLSDADVEVVHVTDGAPRDVADSRRHGFATPAAYAAARWMEARAALALAGVPAARHHGLGVTDQDAAHGLAEIVRRLVPFVARADAVLTHAYEGGHPDHDAVAFAVHAATKLRGLPRRVVEMPFYHAGPEGWIRQCFVPDPGALERPAALRREPRPRGDGLPVIGSPDRCGIVRLDLTEAERDLKRRMAACHATQGETLAAFALDREVFRNAPDYDFARLPHDGDLLYERHGWNLDRAGWLAAARAAEAELGLAGAAP